MNPTHQKTILIVEDDKYICQAYEDSLKRAGYEVMAAHDGIEALDALKTARSDIILLDIVMPRLDGIEALQRIKSDPELKNIPVLITSNSDKPEAMKEAKRLGAKDYVIKASHNMDEVIAKIKTHLR